jgi:cell division topological specificity factor
MRDIILRFFGQKGDSGNDAKARLKFLLVHDEVEISPAQLELMKEEIMEVIAKYVDVDSDAVDFRLDKSGGHIALVSNVPVRRANARA